MGDDVETTFTFDRQSWTPQNYDGGFDGWMNLRRALTRSVNLAAIRMESPEVFDTAHAKLFELLAEPALTALYRTPDGARSLPVFITEFPFEVSPLARRNDENPAIVVEGDRLTLPH